MRPCAHAQFSRRASVSFDMARRQSVRRSKVRQLWHSEYPVICARESGDSREHLFQQCFAFGAQCAPAFHLARFAADRWLTLSRVLARGRALQRALAPSEGSPSAASWRVGGASAGSDAPICRSILSIRL